MPIVDVLDGVTGSPGDKDDSQWNRLGLIFLHKVFLLTMRFLLITLKALLKR